MKWMHKPLVVLMLFAFAIFTPSANAAGLHLPPPLGDTPTVTRAVQWGKDARPPNMNPTTFRGRAQKVWDNINGVKGKMANRYDALTERQKQCMAFHIAYLQATLYEAVVSPKAPSAVKDDAATTSEYYRKLLDYWCSPRDPGVKLYSEYVDNYVGKANARDSLTRMVPIDAQITISTMPDLEPRNAREAARQAQQYINERYEQGVEPQDVYLMFMAMGITVSAPVWALP